MRQTEAEGEGESEPDERRRHTKTEREKELRYRAKPKIPNTSTFRGYFMNISLLKRQSGTLNPAC